MIVTSQDMDNAFEARAFETIHTPNASNDKAIVRDIDTSLTIVLTPSSLEMQIS